jgi:hypothetical protein
MAQAFRTLRRVEAWRFARTAIRAYEREPSPSSSRQVELAMRYLRETQMPAVQHAQQAGPEQRTAKKSA